MLRINRWVKAVSVLLVLAACTQPNTPKTESGSNSSIALEDLQNKGEASSEQGGPSTPTPDSSLEVKIDPRFTIQAEMLWSVKPAGKTTPVSYLIGTVHAPFAEGYTPPESFWKHIDNASALYVETDLEQATSEEFTTQLLNRVINTELNLLDDLGRETILELAKRLQAKNFPAQLIQILPNIEPWFIAQNLSGVPEGVTLPADLIMDTLIRQRGQEAGVSLRFLETPLDQVDAFQAISRAEHLRLIQEALKENPDEQLADFERVFSLYNQDDEKLWVAEIEQAKSQSEAYFENIVAARNRNWVKNLSEVMKQEAVTVAVGNLHMFGDSGLIELLKAEGFEVQFIAD